MVRMENNGPGVKSQADLTEHPEEVSIRVAKQILRRHKGDIALAVPVNHGTGYTIFNVRKYTALRFVEQAARRNTTILMSELFGDVIIG